ncbi:hypothetical protein UFOVP599_54 [uncultured Caudovirales phage]|uniref:DUF7936 domain-containing protein n=1 Tax=uncultured Caudovirales phage TaxID=2100421 RepID=A0A6J5N4C9_9CAUD|nr:hypothetical protein UFOVP599_54 [uncultured Caudovirales phage]
MTITYKWIVEAMYCTPSAQGKTNVVSNVHWRVIATSDKLQTVKSLGGITTSEPFSASIYGVQPLTYSPDIQFTAYSNLTEDVVIGWVQKAIGIDAVTKMQESLDEKIENLINPTVITPPLPW